MLAGYAGAAPQQGQENPVSLLSRRFKSSLPDHSFQQLSACDLRFTTQRAPIRCSRCRLIRFGSGFCSVLGGLGDRFHHSRHRLPRVVPASSCRKRFGSSYVLNHFVFDSAGNRSLLGVASLVDRRLVPVDPGLLIHWESLIQFQIEFQHIDPRLAQDS